MRTYKGLYERLLDKDFIRANILEAAAGKGKRKDVQRVLGCIDKYVDKIYNILEDESYTPHVPRVSYVQEGTRPKIRAIRKIRFFDQIVHHMVVNVSREMFMRSMYTYCCGSVPDRGIHYGKKYVERWVRNDYKNTKYCCQMDIRHYFESVDHETLIALLAVKIKDERMLNLYRKIIESCDEGIPLGYYTSQWLANFMLEGLDHYIKEELHVKYYVRYLDDMVIFGRNKRELHKARAAIAEYLQQLNLEMKGNWQVFRLVYEGKDGKERGKPLDFLGFRFYRNRTTLRKSLMLRISRKAAKIGKKNKPTVYDAMVMLSYLGWIDNSSSYNFYLKHVKPNVDFGQCKKIVSDKSRKENAKNAGNLQKRNGNAAEQTANSRPAEQPVNSVLT